MTNINEIIKINLLIDKNVTSDIYVFYGIHLDDIDLDILFKKEPRNIAFINKTSGTPIFNDEEIKNIIDNNINVKFVEQQIHYDDSIGSIKIKIMNEFSNTFSLDEIYLFCLKFEKLNPIMIYQSLTQNNRLSLTKTRLDQFLLNIIYDENKEPVQFNIRDKDVYDYDDILDLNINEKYYYISKALGQKFFIVSNEYPFIGNPFNVESYDKFIEENYRKTLTTLNNYLLLNVGAMDNNNIYLCLATDVYNNAKKNDFSENYITSLYYPSLLINNNINSLEDLKLKKQNLISESMVKITQSVLDNFQSVNLFYDIYKERTNELNYKKRGIKSLNFIIKPDYQFKLPLEVVFKLLHANQDNPLIKFNSASKPRKENVYRLYADKITKDGKKIPYLTKASILKLIKTIGRTRSVSVLINLQDDKEYSIICEFEENGNIYISCDFDEIMSIDEIDKLFKKAVNPVINEIKSYLIQNGYSINLFESLHNENIKIEQIKYETVIKIDEKIKLNDIMGCLTSIFIIESRDYLKGINMRYKRVNNFNNMTSSEAFIIEQAKQKNGLRGNDLVLALVENYKIDKEEAVSLLEKIVNNITLQRGIRGNDVEIKINPGFKTSLIFDKFKSFITIQVNDIDNINYLNILPIYLDTFIRLTQDKNKKSTNIKSTRILEICKVEEINEPLLVDFTAIAEDVQEISQTPFIDDD